MPWISSKALATTTSSEFVDVSYFNILSEFLLFNIDYYLGNFELLMFIIVSYVIL